MRAGQNPVKIIKPEIFPPQDVTVVVVSFIPYLTGYFEYALDLLRITLNSISLNTDQGYDLLVFDNASCPQARSYLLEQVDLKNIQYLMLADKNVGIPGAWNAAFRAAPGKYVAYADSDVYFHPGWLSAHMEVFETYPNVGMVTGIPLRSPVKFSTATLDWAENNPDVTINKGVLQDWDILWTHAKSLGKTEKEAKKIYQEGEDIQISYRGVDTYLGAGHFQFVALREILNTILPLPIEIAMGNERHLDTKINELGLLRLSLTKKYIQHMGNQPPAELLDTAHNTVNKTLPSDKKTIINKAFDRVLDFWLIKKALLFIHGRIFHWYYRRIG